MKYYVGLLVLIAVVGIGGLQRNYYKEELRKAKITRAEQESMIKKAVKEQAGKIKEKMTAGGKSATADNPLPTSFKRLRAIVEIEVAERMTKGEVIENVQKMCDVISTSPTIKRIKAIAVAGECQEGEKKVFRVIASNEGSQIK